MSSRKSNRLAKIEPSPPPAATDFPPGSANRALLARDCRNGRPDYRADPSKSWSIEWWAQANDDCSLAGLQRHEILQEGRVEEEEKERVEDACDELESEVIAAATGTAVLDIV